VVGVTLADGESIGAKTVVAACSPKHALGTLVGGAHVSQKLAHRIDNFRTRGTTAKLHLAIRGPFTFRSRPEEAIEFARIAPTIDDMERAFDAVKYRVFSERPILDICVPTVSAPSLAPQGDSVASVLVHFAPYDLDGGWNERQAEVLKQAALRVLEPHVEHLPDRIVATELLTPLDLERRYGLTCGQIHHGEHGLDQLLVRPTLDCARYATPITGLYLASGGSFPGGGITCAPGALAAAAIRQATVR
jgi:phytoene dehydrogenase-like protein